MTGIRQEESGLQVLLNSPALVKKKAGQSVTELRVRGSVCSLLCMSSNGFLVRLPPPCQARQHLGNPVWSLLWDVSACHSPLVPGDLGPQGVL